tara:strand:- start:759 stop:1229 length:471 start_codon:yes stop_codon:yes gene_type:complete
MDQARNSKKKKKIKMGKLLQFPTSRIQNRVKIPELSEEEKQAIKEDKFIEQLTEQLSMDILGSFQDNVVHLKSDLFLKDLALVIEAIKSLLKRDFNRTHPMQAVTDNLINIITTKDGKKLTDINYSKIIKVQHKPKPQPQPKEEKSIDFETDMNLD